MPKSYSEYEREYIIKRLKEEAGNCLALYGIKGTTVDELVKRVQIPKGTFYLFYKSKELLIFDVIMEQHELFEKKMLGRLATLDSSNITCDQMTEMIYCFYKEAGAFPLFRIITTGEIEILARKLPEQLITAHFTQDNSMIEKIMAMLPNSNNKNINAFSSAFRYLFMSMLSGRETCDPDTDEALKLIIRGLVIQLMS